MVLTHAVVNAFLFNQTAIDILGSSVCQVEPIASLAGPGADNALVYECSPDLRQNVWVNSLIERASVGDFLLKCAGCGDCVSAQHVEETLLSESGTVLS